jgi:hypothetical protein
MAREPKHSLVANYDDVITASVDPPGFFAGRSLVGLISLRERSLGKLNLEIYDRMSMDTAIETLTGKLGGRVTVNVVFDPQTATFARKR